MTKKQILDTRQAQQKIHRISVEIIENNYDVDEIFLVGINNNGYTFAKLLADQLSEQQYFKVNVHRVRLNPADPAASPIELDIPAANLHGKRIILTDDVANTGRTLFFALKPFLDIVPDRFELAVIVDRKHKSFPIRPDYVGISIATTLLQHIDVDLTPQKMSVSLQ